MIACVWVGGTPKYNTRFLHASNVERAFILIAKQMVGLETLPFILRLWARPTKASSPLEKKAEINTPPCTAPALTAKGMALACSPRLAPTRQVGPLVCPLAVLCPPPCRLTDSQKLSSCRLQKWGVTPLFLQHSQQKKTWRLRMMQMTRSRLQLPPPGPRAVLPLVGKVPAGGRLILWAPAEGDHNTHLLRWTQRHARLCLAASTGT